MSPHLSGGRSLQLLFATIALSLSGPATATTPKPSCYMRKATWAETVLASRSRYAAWWAEQNPGVRLGQWHTTEQKDAFSPRAGVKLDRKNRKGKRLWEERPDLLDGVVHYDLSNHGINEQPCLPGELGYVETPVAADDSGDGTGPAMMFHIRQIQADRARTVTAYLGVEHGLEVWLNGKRVFSRARLGNGLAPEPDQATVELSLKAGTNRLALKRVGYRLSRMEKDFPIPTRRMRGDASLGRIASWFRDVHSDDLLDRIADRAVKGMGDNGASLRGELRRRRGGEERRFLTLYGRAAQIREAAAKLGRVDFAALRLAVRDMGETFPRAYPRAAEYLRHAEAIEKRLPEIRRGLLRGDDEAVRQAEQVVAFQREALLANPLLDFDRMLVIDRKPIGDARRGESVHRGMAEFLGLPQQASWQLDRIRKTYGWDNEIAVLSNLRSAPKLRTLYRPPVPKLISDIDLHYDAKRMLLSMPGSSHKWQVFEMGLDGRPANQLTPAAQRDVHNFDACYLPSGKIAFISTAPFQGVPCSDGIVVAMAYRMDADGGNIRRLAFDQDHDYCPTVTNDGRILYLRWDYTDLPHQWPRILFTMNPDGTGQREYYGSGSYWPNAVFFARPIPGHPTKIAGIVTGHHVGRVGDLVIFDPALGRFEADGVVQRIPGRGKKVKPVIMDKLTINQWPKFTHPWPLGDPSTGLGAGNYFLVSCKPTPGDLWGIYLVDTFDNMTLIKEVEGRALFEPIPLRSRPRPPIIPERTEPARADALMYIEDVYAGPGLAGVPRGAVKKLRLFSYHFAYRHNTGGQHRIGTDGPWEPKRILGTVPVEADGSALFRVPAKTPISIQPLDVEGKALQLMRSWTTAMPGEFVSCVGCHEKQNAAPASRRTIATGKRPAEIQPWHGPVRGFSFPREVQPVLDRYCVGCHDGSKRPDGKKLADLRGGRDEYVVLAARDPKPKRIRGAWREDLVRKYSGVFEPAYFELRRFVRVGGLESDLHVQPPGEFHADTTELVQMLRKGHHGVTLDRDAWERITTWIDLNAPCHGTWRETIGTATAAGDHRRRLDLMALYGGINDDLEVIDSTAVQKIEPILPKPAPKCTPAKVECPGWPFDAAAARRRQGAAVPSARRTVDLGGGVTMKMVLVPAGEFVMGDPGGEVDERPAARVRIDKPFWMGVCEVTNEQYARFDPSHESRFEHGTASFNSERALGPRLDGATQPVVRISWKEAAAFCRWLSERSGLRVALPTEAQWEYACRAGTDTPLHYGGVAADFSRFANVADATINKWATYNEVRRSADQVPRDARFNDGSLVTAKVGRYQPNAWGLRDMHGNVWEWTRSSYRPYPYRADDGRNIASPEGRKTIRGGSWYDRPKRCRSAFRLSYPAWQKVYNVGFRIVCEPGPAGGEVARTSISSADTDHIPDRKTRR